METGPVRFTLEFARIFFSDLGYVGPISMFLIVLISLIGFVIGRCEGWSKSDAVYHRGGGWNSCRRACAQGHLDRMEGLVQHEPGPI
jgi:hypothetical protein